MGKLEKAFRPEPDYAAYGNIGRDFVKDIVQKDGLTGESKA